MDEPIPKFNVKELLAAHPPRTNFNVIRLDGHYDVRVARLRGRFPWHRHSNGDEGWLVLSGRLRIDTQQGSVELGAGEGTTIPEGVWHSPECLQEGTTVAVFNRRGFHHEFRDQNPDLADFRMVDSD